MIPTLECILDRGLAELIIERSVEIITQDGFLFRQGQQGRLPLLQRSGAKSPLRCWPGIKK